MSGPPGEVDGPFIFFRDYDLPGNDAAYYPSLKGDVDGLKAIVLKNPGSLFCGFNTNGWIKASAQLDYSKLVPSKGSTFYRRVQYPGWTFVQGQDSPGNDIQRVTDVSDPIALINRIAELWKDDHSNDSVAAFNTNGWVKRFIKFPLISWPSASPLDGFYIRTTFRDYSVFPQTDSFGNDIKQIAPANDIPTFVRACKTEPTCAGFNTNGWLKTKINIPPSPEPSFKSLWQGTLVRSVWPDFVFLPNIDSPGNDIKQLTGQTIPALLEAARTDSSVVALNTNGWMKSAVNQGPSSWPSPPVADADEFRGLYVRATHDNSDTLLDLTRFALLATGNAFAVWFIDDAGEQAKYGNAVKAANDEILGRISSGAITALEGAQEAAEMRDTLLYKMRSRTSRLGLVLAQTIKPTGGTYEAYLNSYAQRIYSKNFAELTALEAQQVTTSTVEDASRANISVTKLIQGLGDAGKALLAASIACSMFSVVVADEWKGEVASQVGWWSDAIVGGEMGSGVGAVLGPVGAVLGGIAGNILGDLGSSSLSNWFYGSTTNQAATDILLGMLDTIRGHVQTYLESTGKNFYVHRIRTTHLDTVRSDGASSAVALQIAETEVTAQATTDNVFATIVWVKSEQDILPANAANPTDMVTLLQWIAKNLPK